MSEVAEINITEAIENKIDRSKWVKWKFSDLVENIVEKVVPKNSGLEHYIGLEHLDTESLKIRRFGETSTLIGDKLKIYKGDLIFAKRNAYLKRVAIADFDAVASAHSMVLRPKPKNVNPDFLPFFMMSEMFWKRAIEISVGSLSPTINWKALAKQEFLLPPKDQQAQLAELLWAMDEVIEGQLKHEITAQTLLNSCIFSFFKTQLKYSVKLSDIASIKYGITLNSKRKELPKQVDYLRVANVGRGYIDFTDIKRMGCTEQELLQFKLKEDDVLIVEGHANIEEIGRAAIFRANGMELLHQNHLIKVTGCKDILPEVLEAYINSAFGRTYFKRYAKSTSGLNTINSTVVKECKVPKMSMGIQEKFLKEKSLIHSSLKDCQNVLRNSQSLQKSLINQIF
ncbi:MAG: restriction endonuclease subunit S [Marinoscillum sp.]|uniref:restriction endonuclease subunit S n=1 Tax=Marinoscillum sp. TaxID=2024838 RepID=UPI0032FF8ACA